jgi:hypothetical protein
MKAHSRNIPDPHEEIQRLRDTVEELRLLNDIALEASGAGSIEAMLGMIIDKSLNVVNAEQGSVLLVTGEPNKFLKTFIRQASRLTGKVHEEKSGHHGICPVR